jgi:intein/homing endonuclease
MMAEPAPDMNSQIAKQERKLQKQKEMRQKLVEQQQHKQFLNNKKQLEDNDMSLKKLEFENTSKSVDTSMFDMKSEIENQINREIVKKERILEETNRLREQSKKDELSVTIKKVRQENETQLYHYDRVMSNTSEKLKDVQALIRTLGGNLTQLTRTNNRVTTRNAVSSAISTQKRCDSMITMLIEDERKRVKYIQTE